MDFSLLHTNWFEVTLYDVPNGGVTALEQAQLLSVGSENCEDSHAIQPDRLDVGHLSHAPFGELVGRHQKCLFGCIGFMVFVVHLETPLIRRFVFTR